MKHQPLTHCLTCEQPFNENRSGRRRFCDACLRARNTVSKRQSYARAAANAAPQLKKCRHCENTFTRSAVSRRYLCDACRAVRDKTRAAQRYLERKKELSIEPVEVPRVPVKREYTGQQLIDARQGKLGVIAKLLTNPF